MLASTYNAKSPKQGIKRFNSIKKTIHFANLGILFVYGYIRVRVVVRCTVLCAYQHRVPGTELLVDDKVV